MKIYWLSRIYSYFLSNYCSYFTASSNGRAGRKHTHYINITSCLMIFHLLVSLISSSSVSETKSTHLSCFTFSRTEILCRNVSARDYIYSTLKKKQKKTSKPVSKKWQILYEDYFVTRRNGAKYDSYLFTNFQHIMLNLKNENLQICM